MPKKILYVIAQLGVGGGERQLLHLVQNLDRERFSAEVVTFTPGGDLEPSFRALCPVHILPKRRTTEAYVLLSLVALMRRFRPVIAHTYMYPANWRGALAARIAGVPAFIPFVANVDLWMTGTQRWVERRFARVADAIIFESPAVGASLARHAGVPADRLRMIPNGVDVERYRPRGDGEPRRNADLWGDAPVEVIGSVMNLTRKKNPLLLVEAAALVVAARPQARFLVVGEGPYRGEMQERIARGGLGDAVRLLGRRDDVPEILRGLDLLALTSDIEGSPNAVLEAMATGLPVVATAAGGTVELVKDGITGRLVPPRDPERLAGAILDLLADREGARRMGEAGLRRARSEYALPRMVERTLAVYTEVVARRRQVG